VRARAEQGNINHPAYGMWTADFMLQQNESRAFSEKYLHDMRVPWRHKRREMMAIAGIIPVAKWLAKIKQRSDVGCRLCKRAREQRSASTENLPQETYGHINSAFCDRMATTVTAAHPFICRHLYASMQGAQTPVSKLRVVTPDQERSMSTLWQEEEFEQICSRELLTEKAADIEKSIAVKEHEKERCVQSVLYVITFTPSFKSSPECTHLSPITCKLLFMFLHLILCCPFSYCIPHAIIKCRMRILISYVSYLAARFFPT